MKVTQYFFRYFVFLMLIGSVTQSAPASAGFFTSIAAACSKIFLKDRIVVQPGPVRPYLKDSQGNIFDRHLRGDVTPGQDIFYYDKSPFPEDPPLKFYVGGFDEVSEKLSAVFEDLLFESTHPPAGLNIEEREFGAMVFEMHDGTLKVFKYTSSLMNSIKADAMWEWAHTSNVSPAATVGVKELSEIKRVYDIHTHPSAEAADKNPDLEMIGIPSDGDGYALHLVQETIHKHFGKVPVEGIVLPIRHSGPRFFFRYDAKPF